jgi:hypothetical protein
VVTQLPEIAVLRGLCWQNEWLFNEFWPSVALAPQ